MPTGDLHPRFRNSIEGEWARRAWQEEATWRPAGQGDSAFTRVREGFYPVQKGTFRLLMGRLKIAPRRICVRGWQLEAS